MKLPNGYGNVSKLPGRRRRPWRARKTAGWEEKDGKLRQIYINVGYYAAKKEAIDALAALSSIDYVARPKPKTLAEVYAEFIEAKEADGGDIRNNRTAWFHVPDELRRRPIGKVTAAEIEDVMRSSGARTMPKLIKSLFNQLMRYALKHGYIEKSPMEMVDIIKIDGSPKLSRVPFTAEEIEQMRQGGTIYDDIALVGIYTGFRPSEILTLKLENLHDGYIVGGMKTEAGRDRVVPIHDGIREIVDRNAARSSVLGSAYLFSMGNGRPFQYANYRLNFKKRWPNHTAHDTRHTFATIAARSGMDANAIKRIMGHALPDITQGVYTHMTVEDLAVELSKFRP